MIDLTRALNVLCLIILAHGESYLRKLPDVLDRVRFTSILKESGLQEKRFLRGRGNFSLCDFGRREVGFINDNDMGRDFRLLKDL